MAQDIIELTLNLFKQNSILCPLCNWDNSEKLIEEGNTFFCDGCNLEISVVKRFPLELKPISEWYHLYNGG